MHLKHLVHYTLLWIVYINNQCGIYRRLKEQNGSYLKRNNWELDNKRYIKVEFMHRWYLIEAKREGIFTLELGRFLNKEYLRGRQQQECIDNKYLQYIQRKINTKYQPKENNSQLRKGKAHRTKRSYWKTPKFKS